MLTGTGPRAHGNLRVISQPPNSSVRPIIIVTIILTYSPRSYEND